MYIRRRARHSETIESVHEHYMRGVRNLPPPLGYSGHPTPPPPTCGKDLSANMVGKIPEQRGIGFSGGYKYRGENYEYLDRGSFDDSVSYLFSASNKHVNFKVLLTEHLPQAILAFGAYWAFVSYGMYSLWYAQSNPYYEELRKDRTIDIDGRNNIFTLYQAQFWDREKCERSLGFGPEEVVERLRGKAMLAKLIADGVYLVFNDDTDIKYEEFVKINQNYKPVLGI